MYSEHKVHTFTSVIIYGWKQDFFLTWLINISIYIEQLEHHTCYVFAYKHFCLLGKLKKLHPAEQSCVGIHTHTHTQTPMYTSQIHTGTSVHCIYFSLHPGMPGNITFVWFQAKNLLIWLYNNSKVAIFKCLPFQIKSWTQQSD